MRPIWLTLLAATHVWIWMCSVLSIGCQIARAAAWWTQERMVLGNMVSIIMALALCGCATRIRDPRTGHTVFETYGDAQNVTYTGPGYAFHADRIIHSTHTAKTIQSTATLTTMIGAAASGVIKP